MTNKFADDDLPILFGSAIFPFDTGFDLFTGLLNLFGSSEEAHSFTKEYDLHISKSLDVSFTRIPHPLCENRCCEIIARANMKESDLKNRYNCQGVSFHDRFIVLEELSKRTEIPLDDLSNLHYYLTDNQDSTTNSNLLNPSVYYHYSIIICFERDRDCAIAKLKHEEVSVINNRVARWYNPENMISVKFSFPRLTINDIHKWEKNLIKTPFQLDSMLFKLLKEFKPNNKTLPQTDATPFEELISRTKIEFNSDINRFVRHILSKGFGLLGYRYIFLTCTQSGLYSFTFTCIKANSSINSSPEVCRDKIFQWAFSSTSFNELKTTPIKLAMRMSLLLSTTIPTLVLSEDEYELNAPDIVKEYNGKEYTFSDGCGRISLEMAKQVFKYCLDHAECFRRRAKVEYVQNDQLVEENSFALIDSNTTPSAFQIRFRGNKGMLVIDPSLSGQKCIFPKSMVKFDVGDDKDEAHRTIEVMNFSRPSKDARMNHTLCHLMSGCCKKVIENKTIDEILYEMCMKYYEDRIQKFANNRSDLLAYTLLTGDYIGFNLAGVGYVRESIVAGYFRTSMQNLKFRMKNSRRLYGVLDYTNTLKAGEVFICVDGKALETFVVATKEPATHRGDLIKLKAVKYESLMHLKDVIVFSQQSERPDADKITGSDLDGDCFFVTWNPEVINRYSGFDPGEFEPSSTSKKPTTPDNEENINVFHKMIDDVVHRLTNFTTYIPPSDLISIRQRLISSFPEGGWTDESLWKKNGQMKVISDLINNAIDAPKSGKWVDESYLPIGYLDNIPKFPEFHPQSHLDCRVVSKCIVGKMINNLPNIISKTFKKEERQDHYKVGVADYIAWYKIFFKQYCTLPSTFKNGYLDVFNKLIHFGNKIRDVQEKKISPIVTEEIGYLSQFSKIFVMKKILHCTELFIIVNSKRFTTPTKTAINHIFSLVPKDKTIITVKRTEKLIKMTESLLFFDKESGISLYRYTGDDLNRFREKYLESNTMRLCTKLGAKIYNGSHCFFNFLQHRILANIEGLEKFTRNFFYFSMFFFKRNDEGYYEVIPEVFDIMKRIVILMDESHYGNQEHYQQKLIEAVSKLNNEIHLTYSLEKQAKQWNLDDTISFDKAASTIDAYAHHNIIKCQYCGAMCRSDKYIKCSCNMTFYCSEKCKEIDFPFHSYDCGNHKLAKYCYREHSDPKPSYIYLTREQLEKAILQFLSKKFNDSYKVLVEMGDIYVENAMYIEAEHSYNKALNNQLNDPVLYYKLGCVYMKLKKMKEAVIVADKCLDLDKNFTEAYKVKSEALQELGDNENAIICLNKYKHLNNSIEDWSIICANCLKSLLNRNKKRCTECKQRYYCSKECGIEYYKNIHKHECKQLLNLHNPSNILTKERIAPNISNFFNQINLPDFCKEYVSVYPNTSPKQLKLLESSYRFEKMTVINNINFVPASISLQTCQKRWGMLSDELFDFILDAKPGDVFCKPKREHSSQKFYSFRTNYTQQFTFNKGNRHLSVGTDLALLLHCNINIDNNEELPIVKYISYDESAYTIAKSMVLLSMFKQDSQPESIMQVWFSSGWSKQTFNEFKKALTSIDKENQLSKEVKEILNHWSFAKLDTKNKPSDLWPQETSFTQYDIHYNLSTKKDRVDVIRYLLTGEIGQSPIYPSVCMFDNHTSVYYRYNPESIFAILPFDIPYINNSLMDSVCQYLLQNIQKVKDWIISDKLQILLRHQSITPDSIPSEIIDYKPTTINWRNICDYMYPKDFLKIASKCSDGSNTIHSMHSTNWKSEIFGLNLIDYEDSKQKDLLNEALVYCQQSLKSTQTSYLNSLLITHYHNIAEYYFANLYKDQWVDYFLPRKDVLWKEIKLMPFHAFPTNPCILYIYFTLKK
ncbi:hypothetical protein ABK040_016549 [Willaertia magna]